MRSCSFWVPGAVVVVVAVVAACAARASAGLGRKTEERFQLISKTRHRGTEKISFFYLNLIKSTQRLWDDMEYADNTCTCGGTTGHSKPGKIGSRIRFKTGAQSWPWPQSTMADFQMHLLFVPFALGAGLGAGLRAGIGIGIGIGAAT